MAADTPYKPGDPPPGGYLNWHAWAEVQAKAGLDQLQCDHCRLWRFPQELSQISGLRVACKQCAPDPDDADGVSVPDGQTFARQAPMAVPVKPTTSKE